MACQHRFLGLHQPDSLLPDWEIDYLFIGTFNPAWNFPGRQAAPYFYGRVDNNYFWDLVPELWDEDRMRGAAENVWIDFLQGKRIGITDLIVSIDDANEADEEHNKWIREVKDKDLIRFKNIQWNSESITAFIEDLPTLKGIFITNLSAPALIEIQIAQITEAAEVACIPIRRMFSPSRGAARFLGSPVYDNLLAEWQPIVQPLLACCP